MRCDEFEEFLDAYIDDELDVVASSQFDRHLSECAACRARHDRYRQTQRSVKAHMQYFEAGPALQQRLRARLRLSGRDPKRRSWRKWIPPWPAWVVTVSVATVVLLAAILVQFVAKRSSSADVLAQEVVSSHIRSLLANHLSDVVSTDQHTVKPWFNGKLDFAPVVRDLSSKGFPLIGGRLDYIDNRPVAALIYKRRQHTINLFLWPSPLAEASPAALSIRGYSVEHWAHSHMTFWAVSDVNAGDLREFVRYLEE